MEIDKLPHILIITLLLSGCANQISLKSPVYYQEGRYISAQYQPNYYDAYGRLHTDREFAATYQPERYHREMLTTVDNKQKNKQSYSNWLSQPALIGAASGAALAATFADGGITSLLIGAAAGSYAGQVMDKQINYSPY